MFKLLVILHVIELYTQLNIYKLFNDSARFMAYSLSNLFNNFAEGIHKMRCKYRDDIKNVKHGIKYKDCECCFKCANAKDNLID